MRIQVNPGELFSVVVGVSLHALYVEIDADGTVRVGTPDGRIETLRRDKIRPDVARLRIVEGI